MDDFEKARQKPAAWLNDDEKKVIRDNADKLNDEDKAAFASFLDTPDDAAGQGEGQSAGAADAGAGEGGGGGGEGAGAGSGDAGAGDAGAGDQGQPPAFSFKSEDDAKAFVLKLQQEQAAEKQRAIDAATTPEEKKWVEDNYKPKDWDEAYKKSAEYAVKLMEEKQEAREKQRQDNAKRAEADWQALIKEHKLTDVRNPDGTQNPEGVKVHDQIVEIGLKNGKKNFQEAYDLWSIIPEEKGGGYKIAAAAAGTDPAEIKKQQEDAKKVQLNKQKDAAAKLGGQSPAGDGKPAAGALDTPDYATLHKARSARELMRKAGVIGG